MGRYISMENKIRSIIASYGLIAVLIGAILVAAALLLPIPQVARWGLLGFAGGLAIGVPPSLFLFMWMERHQHQTQTPLPPFTAGWGGGGGDGRSKSVTMLLTRGGNFVPPKDQEGSDA